MTKHGFQQLIVLLFTSFQFEKSRFVITIPISIVMNNVISVINKSFLFMAWLFWFFVRITELLSAIMICLALAKCVSFLSWFDINSCLNWTMYKSDIRLMSFNVPMVHVSPFLFEINSNMLLTCSALWRLIWLYL